MKRLIFISLISALFVASCSPNKMVHDKNIKTDQSTPDSNLIALEITNDDNLKDSVSFNNFVCNIVANREFNGDNPEYSKYGELTESLYNLLYRTSDSIIPLSRKMDLVQLLVHHYRLTADYYISFVSNKLAKNDPEVVSRPFLLLPIVSSRNSTPEIAKFLIEQDTVKVPKEYFDYSSSIINDLKGLSKTNFNESLRNLSLKIGSQNNKMFFSKKFQNKYNHLSCWK